MADSGEDEASRIRREKDADSKRRGRAKRRREREAAYADAEKTASNVHTLPLKVPAGVTLERHFQIVSDIVQRIVADETLDLIDRGRVAIAALIPLARTVEVTEFRQRLEDLEARVAATDRHRAAS